MADSGWQIAALVLSTIALAIVFAWLVVWARRAVHQSGFAKARKNFHAQREYLEAKFFEIAASSGRPRGLDWSSCDFQDAVAYARDRQTGELIALVGVTISFTATPGGDMEHVEAVGNLRAATAVFQYSAGRWRTEGRAIFNLNPTEAIHHFQSSLVMVAQDLAGRV